MSIGNTKDIGNKGNNYPYQSVVVRVLGKIRDGMSGIVNAVNNITSNIAPKSITPELIRVGSSTSSTISDKVRSITFANVSDSENVLVLGQVLKPGEVVTFSGGSLNNTYPSNTFSYDTQNGELLIAINK